MNYVWTPPGTFGFDAKAAVDIQGLRTNSVVFGNHLGRRSPTFPSHPQASQREIPLFPFLDLAH
ncbi:uncharacterized protein PG998_004954 [Apiospora kogelbergensis]|uniref:uncharacterized protein n=1 Tax=Apiospora kogelbergensis TaxID=1337665 RepID=UPI00312DE802